MFSRKNTALLLFFANSRFCEFHLVSNVILSTRIHGYITNYSGLPSYFLHLFFLLPSIPSRWVVVLLAVRCQQTNCSHTRPLSSSPVDRPVVHSFIESVGRTGI